jgi:metal-responsive CopG/Arc/MetJ family transcriptional regulator
MNGRDYTTVNVPLNVAKKIDRILAEHGYSSRSEFVRDAIRQLLKKLEKDKEAGT